MNNITDEFFLAKQKLAKDIVGEIVLTDNSDRAIKKWRNIFKISQKTLANELGITPSVISDYESGRRRSPGIKIVNKYVNALLKIDERNGGNVLRSFSRESSPLTVSSAIMDIKEFSSPIPIEDFCRLTNSTLIVRGGMDREIYGYTIIDSLKAITELPFTELVKMYGITTQRALIFTKTSTGKTPMVAIKLTNLHPGLVVVHGLHTINEVAKRIAEVENIPLAICRMESVDKIITNLKNTSQPRD
jgi:putative transcriptional regulator